MLLWANGVVEAAVCTDEEDQSITDAYTAAAATSECAQYSSVSDLLITIMPPCTATDCVDVMKELAESLPNCTTGSSSTSSKKDILLRSLNICATPAPTPTSTASSTNCTSAETEETFNLFVEASEAAACADSTAIRVYEIVFDTPCSSTCASALLDLENALPNCVFTRDDNNKKEYLETQFGYCDQLDNDGNISISLTADHILVEPSSLITNCTADEEAETVAIYLTVATNETCLNYTSLCSHDINVNTDCSTACGELIQDLRPNLPECYLDGINHRDSTISSTAQCEWIVDPDNIVLTLHSSDVLSNSTTHCDEAFDSTASSSQASQASQAQSTRTVSSSSPTLLLTTSAFITLLSLLL